VGGTPGYRFHPRFAGEAQIEYLNFDDDLFGVDIDIDIVTFSANGKAFLLTGPIQPYGLLDLGVMDASLEAGSVDEDNADFILRFGGGLDSWITESISIGIVSSYVLTTGDVEDADYVTDAAMAQYHI
jgi:hypothetical protein